MYHLGGPQFGLMVTLPSAIASANGPHAAALSLSKSDDMTANQLQNHVTQARRMREKLIDQVSKPPEPGWQSAMNQISDTVDRMEKVLSFLQTQVALPVKPVEDMKAIAVFPSGVAMQQSGRTSDVPPSEAESPTVPFSGPRPASASEAARTPRVIYVMDDGVFIVGLPPQEQSAPDKGQSTGPNTGPNTGVTLPEASRDSPFLSPRTARLRAMAGDTADIRAEDWQQDTSQQDQARLNATRQRADFAQQKAQAPSGEEFAVISLPLSEAQHQASQDLIALARSAYAQLQTARTEEAGAVSNDVKVGMTGELSRDPTLPRSPERIEPAPAPRGIPVEAPKLSLARGEAKPDDPLFDAADPFAASPQQQAAKQREDQRIMALQLDGTSDIIYIVPAAKASMDLIA
ncbi:chemotaxis protein CheA [Arenibacterium sp. LLYu02]|uniref:chemotaxis protein CheA n=1 Tax=Arenibacterium sp. LLYu02 TaxID=3404132 RepID=UPI003B222410